MQDLVILCILGLFAALIIGATYEMSDALVEGAVLFVALKATEGKSLTDLIRGVVMFAHRLADSNRARYDKDSPRG